MGRGMLRHPRVMSELPRAFTVAHARAQGTAASALRSRAQWARPFRGLRAAVDATWVDVTRARVEAAGEGVFVFGPSALRLWGLDLPAPYADDGLLHLAVPRPGRAPRGEGVVGVSVGIDPVLCTWRLGIRVTTPARTWVDLARMLSVPALVAVADRLCLPELDACTIRELQVALGLSRRVRGAAHLRAAWPLVVPGAESYPESQIRVSLETAGLPRPLVNAEIRDGRDLVARVDLLFAPWGVVVEYEGAHHADDRRQWRRDLTRIGELQRLGYIVERAHADDLRDPARLVARVRTHLERRGWRG